MEVIDSKIDTLSLSYNDIKILSISPSQAKDIEIDIYTRANIKDIRNGRLAINGLILYDEKTGASKSILFPLYKSVESGVLTDSSVIVENLKHARQTFGVHLIISMIYIFCLIRIIKPSLVDGVLDLPEIGKIGKISDITCLLFSPISVMVLLNASSFLSNASRSLPYLRSEKDIISVTGFAWIMTQYVESFKKRKYYFHESRFQNAYYQTNQIGARYINFINRFIVPLFIGTISYGLLYIIQKIKLNIDFFYILFIAVTVPNLFNIIFSKNIRIRINRIMKYRSIERIDSLYYYGHTDQKYRKLSSYFVRLSMIFAGPTALFCLLAHFGYQFFKAGPDGEGTAEVILQGVLLAWASLAFAIYLYIAYYTFRITQRFQKPLVYEEEASSENFSSIYNNHSTNSTQPPSFRR